MNRLTEVQVGKAKPRDGSYKISDGGWMYLLVHHNGSKYRRLNYQIDGQQRTQALGVWPAVGFKEAREKRDQILGARHYLAWLYPKDQGSILVADCELKSAISHYLKLKEEEKQIHEKKKDLEKEKKVKEQKPCRCGSTTHKRTNHHECPLNKKNIKSE